MNKNADFDFDFCPLVVTEVSIVDSVFVDALFVWLWLM